MKPPRPELQSVSSIYNEAGEPMMSGEAFRFEQQLDMEAQRDWDSGHYDDYDDDYDESDEGEWSEDPIDGFPYPPM